MLRSNESTWTLLLLSTSAWALLYLSGYPAVAEEAKSKHDVLTMTEIMVGKPKHEHEISATGKSYQGKEKAIKKGAELYHKFNCVGCHFDGGGGIGPALIDDEWVYGSSIDNIAATIRQGRPNGMPSFHAVLDEAEIWQLAAYIEDGLKEHPHGADAAGHEHGTNNKKDEGEAKETNKGHSSGGKTKGHQH